MGGLTGAAYMVSKPTYEITGTVLLLPPTSSADTGSAISVGQLRKWIDQPRAMGLSKEAQNLVIQALAENKLGRSDDALRSQQLAAKAIAKLEENPGSSGHGDLLIAQVLLREVQAVSDNRKAP